MANFLWLDFRYSKKIQVYHFYNCPSAQRVANFLYCCSEAKFQIIQIVYSVIFGKTNFKRLLVLSARSVLPWKSKKGYYLDTKRGHYLGTIGKRALNRNKTCRPKKRALFRNKRGHYSGTPCTAFFVQPVVPDGVDGNDTAPFEGGLDEWLKKNI